MPTPGLVSLTVECIGGGGAGGSAAAPDATWIVGGGGGGSGGYSRKTLPAALVRGGVLVKVGGGGQAAAGTGAFAASGGTTSFGALCVANGGSGGGNNEPSLGHNGGSGGGGGAGIGDIALPGANGWPGPTQQIAATTGTLASGGRGGEITSGASLLECWTGQGLFGVNSVEGTGAGGTGAVVNQVAGGFPGGPLGGSWGGSGLCIVTEYCWGDRDDVNAWSPPLNVNLNVRNKPWLPGPPGGPLPPGPRPPGPWPRSEDDP